MTYCYVLGGISILLTILFLIVRTTVGGAYAVVTKTMASFSFILLGGVGIFQGGFDTFSLFVMLGLVCGLIGDILLDNKVMYREHENIYLNSGMLSFGVGHLFYFVATCSLAVQIGKAGPILLVGLGCSLILTFAIMLASKPLKLNFGKFFYQTLAYTLILTFMSAYSITLAFYVEHMWVMAAGITAIFVSDLVLSTQYFGGKQDSKVLTWINHVIYYLGQIMIAASLFLI